MYFLARLFLYVGIVSSVFLVLGLIKPWVLVWWEDVQNRRKVIQLYGVIALCSYILYFILITLI